MSRNRMLFQGLEVLLLAEHQRAESRDHKGDRGEQREEALRSFLRARLPQRFGVVKAAAVATNGEQSPSHDILIYDCLNAPIFDIGTSSIVPVESVYGVIEVKSRLSKQELVDAADNIVRLRSLPREKEGRHHFTPSAHTTFTRAPLFGMVFAFELGANSLDSLANNVAELSTDTPFLLSQVAVLGVGVITPRVSLLDIIQDETVLTLHEVRDRIRLGRGQPSDDEINNSFRCDFESRALGVDTLGFALANLLRVISKSHVGEIDLEAYLRTDVDLL